MASGRVLDGGQDENHVLCCGVCGLIPPSILLSVLTCGRKLLGLWPATQENSSARWSAPNFHQPDSVILQVRAQPPPPPATHPSGSRFSLDIGYRRKCWNLGRGRITV